MTRLIWKIVMNQWVFEVVQFGGVWALKGEQFNGVIEMNLTLLTR